MCGSTMQELDVSGWRGTGCVPGERVGDGSAPFSVTAPTTPSSKTFAKSHPLGQGGDRG